MITNSNLTVYHKILDEETRLEKWVRNNYSNVWAFGGKGSSINTGFENANDINVRVPYFEGLDVKKFAIGDIIVCEELDKDIETQKDLIDYEIYNITSITNNNFGNNPHLHIGGK